MHTRQVITWVTWLVMTPAIMASARRYPFVADGRTRGRWLARHVMYGSLFSAVSVAVAIVLRSLFGASVSDALGPATLASFVARFAAGLVLYAMIALSYQAVLYHRAARERDALAARLRADLAEARLANLEGRLRPHFLFNALNAVAALVREDPRAAETMIEQLSELLRASLRAHPLREVPLDDELRLTEQYLAIQSARFQERLRATIKASVAARRAHVPQLILQPLVENAVRHGIAPRESGGSVSVTADVDGDTLTLTVEDDGVGVGNAPTEQAGGGIGLDSVQSRLAHIYGARHQFQVRKRSPTGTTITIALPYRPASA